MPAQRVFRVIDLTGEQVVERRFREKDGEMIGDEVEVVLDDDSGQEVEVFLGDPGRPSLVHPVEGNRIAGEGKPGASTARVSKRLRRAASPDRQLKRINEAAHAAMDFEQQLEASSDSSPLSGQTWRERFDAWRIGEVRSRRGSKRVVPSLEELDRLREAHAPSYDPVRDGEREATLSDVAAQLHVSAGSIHNARSRERKQRF
jgi:hypothetical protein